MRAGARLFAASTRCTPLSTSTASPSPSPSPSPTSSSAAAAAAAAAVAVASLFRRVQSVPAPCSGTRSISHSLSVGITSYHAPVCSSTKNIYNDAPSSSLSSSPAPSPSSSSSSLSSLSSFSSFSSPSRSFLSSHAPSRSFSTPSPSLTDEAHASRPAHGGKRIIFSGIQPTGDLHLGNYLGAIKNWVDLQDAHTTKATKAVCGSGGSGNSSSGKGNDESGRKSTSDGGEGGEGGEGRDGNTGTSFDEVLYSVVDLHAITVPQDPRELRTNSRMMVAALLACGIDPATSTIFIQSHVRQHTELAWVLSTLTNMGWLQRMTQYKDKSKKKGATLGLFSYPVLMAADVLLYKATHVPVGDDQLQHLELARDIAQSFNHTFKDSITELHSSPSHLLAHPSPSSPSSPSSSLFFPPPSPLIGSAKRVMSLRNAHNKMSKSDKSELSRINLIDDDDTIAKKIRRAKTDSISELYYDKENRAEVANLMTIYSALTGAAVEDIPARYGDMLQFKQSLAQVTVDALSPIRSELQYLLREEGGEGGEGGTTHLDRVLREGQFKASEMAEDTMQQVRTVVGLQ